MHPFAYVRATDAGDANTLALEPGSEVIAGGTDMLQLMKDDVRRPRRLVDITALPWTAIEAGPAGLRLGALARMSDVADHPAVRENYPVVAQALLASASPQVRNMATIGGNLLQRTRCVYFRDSGSACNKRAPGSGCSAIGGENRMHAVLGGSDHCVATHATDLAVALVALDAVVVVQSEKGERRVPLEQFHLLPGDTPERETVLAPGDIIAAIEVPAASLGATLALPQGARPRLVRVRAGVGCGRARHRQWPHPRGAFRAGRRRHQAVACPRCRSDARRATRRRRAFRGGGNTGPRRCAAARAERLQGRARSADSGPRARPPFRREF